MDIISTDHVIAEAMCLPMEARAYVAERLLASLDDEESEPLSPAWSAEIKRRWAAYEHGEEKTISAEDLFKKLDARIPGAKQ